VSPFPSLMQGVLCCLHSSFYFVLSCTDRMKEPTPSGWWGRLTALRANVSPFPSLMQGVSGFAACVVFLLFTRCWLFHSVCAGLGSPLLIEKKRKTTQAAKHSLHQLRKRRHMQVWIAPSSRWPPAMCLIPRVGQDSAYTPYIW